MADWNLFKVNHDTANGPPASLEDREHDEMVFFKKSGFSCLKKEHVGISTLRDKLSRVLFDQIRQELPELVLDIDRRIREAQDTITKLGSHRGTAHEPKDFLIQLSDSFQRICGAGINGFCKLAS
jgi:anaerobic glycerol-3-phosphate dehydrogenase